MKKKILASLLAVCMFVGMAVPALAAYSSVEGDPEKISIIEFTEKSVSIANGADKDISKLVKAYQDKNTLVNDISTLSYSLKGDSLAFGINESTVSAVDNSGTAVVVVSTADGKVKAELTVKATSAATKFATGFRFTSAINTMAVGANAATDASFKVTAVPAGATITGDNYTAITEAVKEAAIAAMQHFTDDGKIATTAAPAVEKKLFVTGVPADWDVEISLVAGKADVKNTAVVTKTAGKAAVAGGAAAIPTKLEIVLSAGYDKAAIAGAIPVATVNQKLNTVVPGARISVEGGANIITTGDAAVLAAANPVKDVEPLIAPEFVADTNNSEIKFVVTNLSNLLAASRKTVAVKATMTDKDGINPRIVPVSTSFYNVEAVKAKSVGGPGSITIEVGEVYKAADKLAFGPSTANVFKDVIWSQGYATDAATAYDYALVDESNGKITGIAVGTNKIIATLATDTSKSAAITVTVVAKGTKPAVADKKASLNPVAKMIIGGTYKITVKDAGALVPTFSSYDEKVATVAADGTVKANAAGLTKIKVMVGTEALYVTVTVAAAPAVVVPTTTTKKPTTVPATGV